MRTLSLFIGCILTGLTQCFNLYRLDVSTECRRLLDGFERNFGKSESKKTMQELRSVVAVPAWQKSQFWKVYVLTCKTYNIICIVCKMVKGAKVESFSSRYPRVPSQISLTAGSDFGTFPCTRCNYWGISQIRDHMNT